MADPEPPRLVAVHRRKQLVLLSDDTVIPISDLLDDEGRHCNLEEAVAFVAGPDATGRWHADRFDSFVRETVH